MMPICESCHNKWSWKQTIKKTTTLNSEFTCPFCVEKQYQTQQSKTKVALLTPIGLLPLPIQLFFDVPGLALLILFPVLAVILLLIYPFFIEISSKEQYLY